MPRRILLHLVLIVAVIAAGGWLTDAAVAKKRGNVGAGTLTVCAKGCQFSTLQAAVDAANSGDTILIKSGPPLVGATSISRKKLTIDGDGQNQSILDGGGRRQVLRLVDADVIIKDVTIRNGVSGPIGGGGILIERPTLRDVIGSLELVNSVVTGNQGNPGGGGIANWGAHLTVRNSRIVDNHVTQHGGGVFITAQTTIPLNVAFIRTEVKDNHAEMCGGGIYFPAPALGQPRTISLINTDVNDNTAGRPGGGICTAPSQVILSNGSTVERNTPDDCFPANGCVGAPLLP